MVVADIDRDGRNDIVVANAGNGTLTYFVSSIAPPPPPPTDTPVPTSTPLPTNTAVITNTPSATPTRSQRQTPTHTADPSRTPRGVISVEGNSCAIDPNGSSLAAWISGGLMLFALRQRRRSAASRMDSSR